MTTNSKSFTLDGEMIPDLSDFAILNDLDTSTLDEIDRLEVGASLILGGGASAEFTFARVA